MEFNVYIKTFEKIYEMDTMPFHTILELKKYISKKIKLDDFILIYENKEIKYGTILSNNIKQDTIIYVHPKIKSGIIKEEFKNKINFSSIDEIKQYIKDNLNSS